MDNIATQIAQILEAEGVGTFATDLFAAKEPDSPDNCITVYDTGGVPDDCLDLDVRAYETLNFQVRVRNNKYITANSEMESVRDVLDKGKNTIVDSNGTLYFTTWLTSLPIQLQRDTKNRSVVTANFSCFRGSL
jgi:hypothetical protein